MKLLIVDDEKLTREGIISSIAWESLGVSEVYQADDGVRGLELAKEIEPDIVLSDVRMPRMDGIEMSSRLKELFPNINIVFMSGYSDKEYLKAAIRLKAISYVEKPIDPQEIEDAITESLRNKQFIKKTADTELEHRKFAVSSLATRLIYPGFTSSEAILAFKELNFEIEKTTDFHTIIFSFKNSFTHGSNYALTSFYMKVHEFLESFGFHEIHGIKQERFLIYHIWGEIADYAFLKEFATNAAKYAALLGNDFFIVVGKKVIGASNIFDSYNSAVIQLQSCFYHPYGSWFIYESDAKSIKTLQALPFSMDNFRTLLNQKNPQIFEITKVFFEDLILHKNLLPNQVKDFYFQLFSSIQEAYHILQIPLPELEHSKSVSLEYISSCDTIFELNQLLLQELNLFFKQADLSRGESSPITTIKNFIAAHYQDESLSIKDISEHAFLSTSYICTLFKNETGQTLNQYITKYRIERAKKLLADPRNKISDISSKVGYSDGNYFGKTFKKIVGVSPTEYRDQVIDV